LGVSSWPSPSTWAFLRFFVRADVWAVRPLPTGRGVARAVGGRSKLGGVRMWIWMWM
jgi:hypothetical protein